MALRDIFKRKPKAKSIEKPKLVEKPKEVKAPKPKKEVKIGEAYKILKTPHITEKATDLTGRNQYVFKIWERANKTEVKKAIEDVFGVDVVSIKIINIPRKKRRLGRIEGFRKGYKKAIVRIKEGQKIEVLPR
jgi:large subunit ribosomal protein L23